MFAVFLGIHIAGMIKDSATIDLIDGILAVAGLAVLVMHYLPDKG